MYITRTCNVGFPSNILHLTAYYHGRLSPKLPLLCDKGECEIFKSHPVVLKENVQSVQRWRIIFKYN